MKPYTVKHSMDTVKYREQPTAHSPIADEKAKWLQMARFGVSISIPLAVFSGGVFALSHFPLKEVVINSTSIAAMGTSGLWLVRELLNSETLLFWVEVLTQRDLNADGKIGVVEDKPSMMLASEHEINKAYNYSKKLWRYSWQQLNAAAIDGKKINKPWSRRAANTNVGIPEDRHKDIMAIWILGGLLGDIKDKTLKTQDYQKGFDLINEGMRASGYMRLDGDSWLLKN